jgi:hypothetical protein
MSEEIRRLHVNLLLEKIQVWMRKIDYLREDIPNNGGNYILYVQDNVEKLDNLSRQIKILRNEFIFLRDNHHDLEQWQEDYFFSRQTYNQLSADCEEIFLLSSSTFRTKQLFPVNWVLQAQADQRYQFSISQEFGTTVAKIGITPGGSRTEALAAALEYSFMHVDNLDFVDLSHNELDDLAIQLLANALRGLAGYEHIPLVRCEVLILSHNSISKKGLKILLEALTVHPSDKQILLNNNLIFFDLDFFNDVVIPVSRQARLINLDLTMNFIPKGYMFLEDSIYIYYPRERMPLKLSACGFPIDSHVAIESIFADRSREYCHLRSLLGKDVPGVNSLVAAIDENNAEPEIGIGFGVIGLFANRATIPLFREHAYLMLEGISEFGQRYLIRGDLYSRRNKAVHIVISQCSPQDFLRFTRDIRCRTGTFGRADLKACLDKMYASRSEQGFYGYARHPSGRSTLNCLTWAARMLETIGINIDGWIPSLTVRRKQRRTIFPGP